MARLQVERERSGWTRLELARRPAMQNVNMRLLDSGQVRPHAWQLAKLAALEFTGDPGNLFEVRIQF